MTKKPIKICRTCTTEIFSGVLCIDCLIEDMNAQDYAWLDPFNQQSKVMLELLRLDKDKTAFEPFRRLEKDTVNYATLI